MFKLMFPCDKISGGDGSSIARLFESRQLLLVNLILRNDPCNQPSVIFQIIGRHERRQIMLLPRCRGTTLRRNAACIDAFDQRFRDTVTVVPNVILYAGAVFANRVGPDDAAVLQMDDLCSGTTRRKHTYTSAYKENDRCPH